MKIQYCLLLFLLLLGFTQCKSPAAKEDRLSDDALMDTVQRRTFNYFWEGAEPNSGLARERIHMDGVYPENDQNVITSGGSGFGIMAILAGIDRGYVTRQEGLERMYNPQIQISAESETKRSIFREKDKTKRSKKESAQHSKSRNKSFVMTSVSAL